MQPLTQQEVDSINAWVVTASIDDRKSFIEKIQTNPGKDADIIRATLNPQS